MKSKLSSQTMLLVAWLAAASSPAQQTQPGTETALQIMNNLKRYTEDGRVEPRDAEANIQMNLAPDGRVRHLRVPAGHAIQPLRPVAGKPEDTARFFLEDVRALLGVATPNADFAPFRSVANPVRTSVRLQQQYRGVPVFDAHAVVQMNAFQGVLYLGADLAMELNTLDADPGWMTPLVTAAAALGIVDENLRDGPAKDDYTATPPELTLFAPEILDEPGKIRLVWQTQIDSESASEVNARWLIDAKNGRILRRYALTHSALERRVRDYMNSIGELGALRTEGEASTGQAQVDACYDFLGDTYDFYWNQHHRDSYDNDGHILRGRVRKCISGQPCPWPNAQWNGSALRFGDGFAVDDVVGHEFTHAVVQNTSELLYANTSGAINESLADIWGEAVDGSNTAGDDSAAVLWQIGEDLPGGAFRDMSDPTAFGQPDRVGSPQYVQPVDDPNSDNDSGGVHTNSGVNNKLCYLLTDGDTFNGWTVDPMGLSRVIDLYYEANAYLLTSGANWDDLFQALRQAAVNLGWTQSEQLNLLAACRAVQIGGPQDVYVDGAGACIFPNGAKTCGLVGGPFHTVSEGVDAAFPADRLYLYGGSYDESVVFVKRTVIRSVNGTAIIGD